MSTGFSSGMRLFRVKILNRTDAVSNPYGLDAGGVKWEEVAEVWADVTFAKGKAPMNAGALDAYAVEMVRMNWNSLISMRSRVVYNNTTYQILPDTFHPDKHGNTIQFHCQAIIGKSEHEGSSSDI